MNKSYVNRWGNTLRVGDRVSVRHPRGGRYAATIAKIETRGAYVKAYGARCILANGGSCSLDDCTPDLTGCELRA